MDSDDKKRAVTIIKKVSIIILITIIKTVTHIISVTVIKTVTITSNYYRNDNYLKRY